MQNEDTKLLYEAFYRNYDNSRLFHVLQEYEKFSKHDLNKFRFPLLGQGYFCSAFKVSGLLDSALSLTLCIAHEAINDGSDGDLTLKRWLQRMKLLQTYGKKIPLIPPFALLKTANSLAWVTPFGSLGPEKSKAHWLPLEHSIKSMQNSLRLHSLHLSDYIQIKTWKGIPFVFDMSDLRKH